MMALANRFSRLSQTEPEVVRHYLSPGEYYFSKQPSLVTTVLGSCVSVTFYSTRHKLGGITHAIMPMADARDNDLQSSLYRYVDSSIEGLIQTFVRHKVNPKELEIKVFGGAQTYNSQAGSSYGVGRKNVEIALEKLNQLGLKIRVVEAGGNYGRKLLFFTHKGEVWVKKLYKSSNNCSGEKR